MTDLFAHHIDNGFYKLTDAQAKKLAATIDTVRAGTGLPKDGWQKQVTIDGRKYWLTRTPYRYHLDAPDRGWVWAIF